jgi:hypothetical protein
MTLALPKGALSDDIDLTRPTVTAVCPFCGGDYAAGYRRSSPTTVTIQHTLPHCDHYAGQHPIAFLRAARLAGAERRRL